ncbi:MAG: ABC transporter permease, partial [Rhodospirillales bacterium]|nr:ABC transporter permease [Rhodospirillales bacterium]
MSGAGAAMPEAAAGRARLILGSGSARAGIGIVLFWTVCALFGPWIVPWNPYHDSLMHTLAPPSLAHPFGTDQLGRDIFSRVIVGSRSILSVAPL